MKYLGHNLIDKDGKEYTDYRGYRLYMLPDGKCRVQDRDRTINVYESIDDAVAFVSDVMSDVNHSGRE